MHGRVAATQACSQLHAAGTDSAELGTMIRLPGFVEVFGQSRAAYLQLHDVFIMRHQASWIRC